MRKQDFINLLIADIKEENKKRGNKLFNSVVLAQACLETGWGSSTRMIKAKAVFGIKAGSNWRGKVYNTRTHEVYSGKDVVINGTFRAYNSYRESISDYMDLIYNSPRYQKALNCNDYVECILEIRKGGYATDLNYVNKIINIIRYNNLTKYDFMDYEVETEKKTYLKYQIKSGDTLSKIATKFNTTVDNLVKLNSIKDPNVIFAGDIILVTEFSQKYYKIKYGDTLSSIARKFNTTVDRLCDINNIKNPNKIYAGRNIKI